MQDLDKKSLEIKYYKKILSKYSQYIEEKENKSILELRYLIDMNDEVVKSFAKKIQPTQDYIYGKDFFDCVKKLSKEISYFHTVKPEINIYLNFEDLVEIKAGTKIDKILFCCSVLRYLKNPDSLVVITLNEPSLIFSYNDIYYELDVDQGELKFIPNQDIHQYFENKIIVLFNEIVFKEK